MKPKPKFRVYDTVEKKTYYFPDKDGRYENKNYREYHKPTLTECLDDPDFEVEVIEDNN